MKRAKISELKNHLSRYLQHVRDGESVIVYDRDRPIARIEPVPPAGGADLVDWPAPLVRAGVIRGPTAALPPGWLEERVAVTADVVGALLAEREEGR